MSTLTDFHATTRVQLIPVEIVVPCDVCGRFNVARVGVWLEHSREPDVSLPACRTCGTPMEPMRDDVIDTALYSIRHGEA